MLRRRLPRIHRQRARFKKHIRLRALQPLPHVSRRSHMRRLRRPMPVQQRNWIESIRVREPPHPPRRHARQPPSNVVLPPQFRLFRDQQTQKSSPDIPKSHHRQVIRRHSSLLGHAQFFNDYEIQCRGGLLRPPSSMQTKPQPHPFCFPTGRDYFPFASPANFLAASEINSASFSSTCATRAAASSACFHFFCSSASRTAGIAFAAYPVYAPGAYSSCLYQNRPGNPSAVVSLCSLCISISFKSRNDAFASIALPFALAASSAFLYSSTLRFNFSTALSSGAKFKCGGTSSTLGGTYFSFGSAVAENAPSSISRFRSFTSSCCSPANFFTSLTYIRTSSAKSPNSNGRKSASASRIIAVPPVCESARP